MKLLIDQNLSPKLTRRLADIYPGSAHVQDLGLDSAPDTDIWDAVKSQGFAIVTRDEDFDTLGLARGFPPKIIWIVSGNCTTDEIESLLRMNQSTIEDFERDATVGTLCLG